MIISDRFLNLVIINNGWYKIFKNAITKPIPERLKNEWNSVLLLVIRCGWWSNNGRFKRFYEAHAIAVVQRAILEVVFIWRRMLCGSLSPFHD